MKKKKIYAKPTMTVENFTPNSYVAVCGVEKVIGDAVSLPSAKYYLDVDGDEVLDENEKYIYNSNQAVGTKQLTNEYINGWQVSDLAEQNGEYNQAPKYTLVKMKTGSTLDPHYAAFHRDEVHVNRS